MMNKQDFKQKVYSELAKVTKALGNPHRMEIIDLLAQGPFTVEQIANYTGLSIANTSQHLQTLKHAKLVTVARDGNFIRYSLAGSNVYDAWVHLRELGMSYNAEVEKIVKDFRAGYDDLKAVEADELLGLLEKNKVILLDVRPEEEYNRGHIHKALSMPVDQLGEHLKKLPKGKTIVAYCRGPFCVYADEAVKLLQKQGYKAQRMLEGFPDWQAKGYPIVSQEKSG
ncbi:metalloregulator ArsR/SmtB family transcription factor [Chitinophaga sp. HK235]|uniref:ArsR/SmtB family transcription factor n=1 Tax=Chitinophaga sp. HK235 TaxID=2952571 RepID=UPI001BA6CA8E|nr:metalloregulator ArsR/SmtB family transcription factor [Chitinophaga sp. HK235]